MGKCLCGRWSQESRVSEELGGPVYRRTELPHRQSPGLRSVRQGCPWSCLSVGRGAGPCPQLSSPGRRGLPLGVSQKRPRSRAGSPRQAGSSTELSNPLMESGSPRSSPAPPRQRQRPRTPREPVPRHWRQSRPPATLCFPCFTALRGFCGWFSVCRCYFPGKTHNPTLYWSPSHPGQSKGDGLTRPGSFTIGGGTSHRNSERGIFTLVCNFDARNISPPSTGDSERGFTEI